MQDGELAAEQTVTKKRRKATQGQWKLTEREKVEAKQRFLVEFRNSFNLARGAAAAGVSRSTLRNWRNEDPTFAERWDAVHEACIDDMEMTLFEIARNPDMPAQARITAAFGVLNAYRDGYRRNNNAVGGVTQINFVLAPAPGQSPKQLPMATGEVIDAEDR